MVNEHHMSERRACALVGLSRDTYRHSGHTSALNAELRDKIVETAHARRRWGYRMIHDVLRPQYPGINHKRVYRIYTAEGLSIRKRKKAKRIVSVQRTHVDRCGQPCLMINCQRAASGAAAAHQCGWPCAWAAVTVHP